MLESARRRSARRFFASRPLGTRSGRPGRSACAPLGRRSRTIRCSICSHVWHGPAEDGTVATTPLQACAELVAALAGADEDSNRGALRPRERTSSTAARMLREVVTAWRRSQTPARWFCGSKISNGPTPRRWMSLRVLDNGGIRPSSAAGDRASDGASASAPLRRAQIDLLARAHASELNLQALATRGRHAYLGRQLGLGCGGIVAPLHRLTNGNPLFLVTAIEHLVRKGHFVEGAEGGGCTAGRRARSRDPGKPGRNGDARSTSCASDERQAINAASVVGAEFSLWLAAHAADMDELALEPVLEVLARRRGPSSCARASSSWPTASSVRSIALHTASTRRSCSSHTAPAARVAAHQRAGLAMERIFMGRDTKRRRISPVTFTASAITCARRGICGLRPATRSSATRRAKPRRSSTAPRPTPRT